MREDAQLRQGNTLRQCCRLAIVLLLLDGHLPPSLAIPIARSNELLFLRAIATRLSNSDADAAGTDPIVVIILGELWARLDEAHWTVAEPNRVRLVSRSAINNLWSSSDDLHAPGQRLVVDVGSAALAMWRWMRIRNLLPPQALIDLLAEIEGRGAEAGYQPQDSRSRRR